MTRQKPTLNSYGPHLMATLIEGSRREVKLELPWRLAAQLRQRLNSLRSLMHRESHPMSLAVQRTAISIKWGPKYGLPEIKTRRTTKNVTYPEDLEAPVLVIIGPKDDEFLKALKNAGINPQASDADLTITTDTASSPNGGAVSLEDILSELKDAR